MARLLTAGAETLSAIGENKTMEGGITTSGTVTVDTGTVRSGSKSFKCDRGAGDAAAYVTKAFTGATGTTYYARCAIYLSTLPTANAVVMLFTGPANIQIRYRTVDSKLDVINFTGNGLSAPIAAATWYVIELSVNMNATGGTDDTIEARLDGTSFMTGTGNLGTTGLTDARFGLPVAAGANIVAYVDDIALNDSTGADQNSWPGLGKQVLLLPISDNAIGTGWTGGAGGASNLFAAVDNLPPVGVADASGTDTSQIRNASDATANYLANLTTYATAGITAADTVNLVQPWVITGAPSATGAKTGALQLTSNPAEGAATAFQTTSNFFRASGVNAGTYPTGWAFSTNPITYAPSVTVGSSPVLTLDITGGSATRIAMCCFMGLYVDYTSGAAVARVPRSTQMPQLLAH